MMPKHLLRAAHSLQVCLAQNSFPRRKSDVYCVEDTEGVDAPNSNPLSDQDHGVTG